MFQFQRTLTKLQKHNNLECFWTAAADIGVIKVEIPRLGHVPDLIIIAKSLRVGVDRFLLREWGKSPE